MFVGIENAGENRDSKHKELRGKAQNAIGLKGENFNPCEIAREYQAKNARRKRPLPRCFCQNERANQEISGHADYCNRNADDFRIDAFVDNTAAYRGAEITKSFSGRAVMAVGGIGGNNKTECGRNEYGLNQHFLHTRLWCGASALFGKPRKRLRPVEPCAVWEYPCGG